jgi:hypothetical protein
MIETRSDRSRPWWRNAVVLLAAALIIALAAWLALRPALLGSGTVAPPAPSSDDKARPGGLLQGSSTATNADGARPGRLPMVELQTPQTVIVGKYDAVTYTIGSAAVEARNAESVSLVLQVRMRNASRYPVNFWDASFQLVANDAAAITASGGLNVLVEGRSESAFEPVQFPVPRNSAPRALRIEFGGESTEVPLRLI